MKKLTLIFCTCTLVTLFSACIEGPPGEEGPQGEQGPQGSQGPEGNANVDYYEVNVSLSSFHHYSSSNIWGVAAPSSIPYVNPTDAVLAYLYMDPTDGYYEWVALPFTHYFNTGTYFNFFSFSIDDGDVWFYIRNSGGLQPYSTMSGTLSYKVFIIKSSGKLGGQDLIPPGLDISDYRAVMEHFKIDADVHQNFN